jgi:hypothetical protein
MYLRFFRNFPRLHLGCAECTQGSVSERKTDLADDLFPTFLYMSSLGRCSVSEVAGTNSRNKGNPVEGPIQGETVLLLRRIVGSSDCP